MGTQGWNANAIPGQLSTGPLCIASYNNAIIVFYKGNTDSSINYTISKDGINWSAPLALWNQGVSTAMSVTTANGNIYLVYTGDPTNQDIWVTSFPLSTLFS